MIQTQNLECYGQEKDICVLLSYAMAAGYFIQVRIAEFFSKYCSHHGETWVPSAHAEQQLERLIGVDLANYGSGGRMQQALYSGTFFEQELSRRAENTFSFQQVVVNRQRPHVELTLGEKNALLIATYGLADGNHHMAVFGRGDVGGTESWFQCDTRSGQLRSIRDLTPDPPAVEFGDSFLLVQKDPFFRPDLRSPRAGSAEPVEVGAR